MPLNLVLKISYADCGDLENSALIIRLIAWIQRCSCGHFANGSSFGYSQSDSAGPIGPRSRAPESGAPRVFTWVAAVPG